MRLEGQSKKTGIANLTGSGVQIGYPSGLSISFSDHVTFRTHQIAERRFQCCKLELVAEVEGFPGHDAPTVNDGVGDHAKPHPEQHAGGWQASRFPYYLPEGLRKLLA